MSGGPVERYAIGQPVRRVEDRRLLVGAGRFVDDLEVDGPLAHARVLRSPHAHAELAAIDARAALALPGVLAVLTGAEWRADGLGDLPTRSAARSSDGAPLPATPRPALACDRVRFVGDPVALVVAESPAIARAASERIVVDYRPLPAVADAAAALEPGAPLVWEHCPGNACVRFEAGDAAAVERAFARAAHVTRLELHNQRLTAVPIEPRAAIGRFDAASGRYTLLCATQNVHANRDQLARDVFHVPEDRIRLVAYDVGGGFGAKNPLYPEHALVLWAARRTGRAVKWVSERGEGFLADVHGRDQRSVVELALDAEGRFLALRTTSVGNVGAYLSTVGPFTPTGGTARTQGGPYRFPAIHFRATAAFTHTAPTDPYRGAGRPEATYQVERVIDCAAAELGIDPIELRRRNLLRREELPWKSAVGTEIECGDFPALLERALELADHGGFAARAAASRARGRLRGFAACPYLECTGGGPREHARLEFRADGGVRLAVGSQGTGTGHETTLAQIVAARLGIDIEQVEYLQGDTDATPHGGGHGGSRALETGGAATVAALEEAIAKGARIAAHLLEAAVEDLEHEPGRYRVAGTDRTVAWPDVVRAALAGDELPPELRGGLDSAADYQREAVTFPNGCHCAEVEVDPETGEVTLLAYTVVDDFGTIVNPLTARGQVMGGTAQGIGQALLEEIVYAPDSAQLLSGSLLDYALPRARDLPPMRVELDERCPSRRNPLGVKGSGEAGCCGAPPAVVGAVMNALAAHGVRHLDMPLTAERVWQALRAGRAPLPGADRG